MASDALEEITAWKTGEHMARQVFELAQEESFQDMPELTKRLQSVALDVCCLIARGEEGPGEDLLTCLYRARASAAETRSLLRMARGISTLASERPAIHDILDTCQKLNDHLKEWTGRVNKPGAIQASMPHVGAAH